MQQDLIHQITAELQSLSSASHKAGMSRFGINTQNAIGASLPSIQKVAKKYRYNHALALELWNAGLHELRIMAALVDDYKQLTPEQMDNWVKDFDSWDVCDQVCLKLFCHSPFSAQKIPQWAASEEEFVRRAAFALMASQAVHLKKEEDAYFLSFFPLMEQYAIDERNFVKKSVSWALRQSGKRNPLLRNAAIELATQLQLSDSRSARWIGRDAYKELSK